jgi:hypothetical protein
MKEIKCTFEDGTHYFTSVFTEASDSLILDYYDGLTIDVSGNIKKVTNVEIK